MESKMEYNRCKAAGAEEKEEREQKRLKGIRVPGKGILYKREGKKTRRKKDP